MLLGDLAVMGLTAENDAEFWGHSRSFTIQGQTLLLKIVHL